MYSSATPHMSLVVGAVLQSEEHEFHWPFTVYLDDTDAGGIVYHGNYVKYFERARTYSTKKSGGAETTTAAFFLKIESR